MKRYDVKCQGCGEIYHELTKAYTDKIPCNGAMFSLKQRHRNNGCSAFPEYDSTEFDNLSCPGCDAPYVDSTGRIVEGALVERNGRPTESKPEKDNENLCIWCMKSFKSRSGLVNHIRIKHADKRTKQEGTEEVFDKYPEKQWDADGMPIGETA